MDISEKNLERLKANFEILDNPNPINLNHRYIGVLRVESDRFITLCEGWNKELLMEEIPQQIKTALEYNNETVFDAVTTILVDADF
jgi:hypothetical protein